MTTLKNSDREEALRRILEEIFTPRFSAIRSRLQELLREWLKNEHPEFLRLIADTKLRRYTTGQNVRNFYIEVAGESSRAARPVWGKQSEVPAAGNYLDREIHILIQDNDTQVPYFITEFKTSDRTLSVDYADAWSRYSAAYSKLSSLLWTYSTREKFIADFPEFAKYLPPVVVKAKLPTVVVKDVRADLRKLGIPQS